MKKFFNDLYFSFFYSIKTKKTLYIIFLLSVIIGLVIGIILSFSYDDIDFVLDLSNKNYKDFLNGTAELSTIFVNNFKWVVVANLISILLSISFITYFLGLCYIGYQSAILVMTIASIISNFRFAGIINSLLFILPFNLIIILCLGFLLTLFSSFFSDNRKSKLKMFSICNDKYIYFKAIVIILFEILICLFLSFIVPLTLKSFIIVSF